jgi:hypothetical protein
MSMTSAKILHTEKPSNWEFICHSKEKKCMNLQNFGWKSFWKTIRLPIIRDAEYPGALFRILTGVFKVKLNEKLLLRKEQERN